MLVIAHKVGDTFYRACVESADGAPLDLTGYTLAAQVRTAAKGTLVCAMTVTKDADQGANPGVFTLLVAAADTAEWTPGVRLAFDVQFTSGGGFVHSMPTVYIDPVTEITSS